MKVNSEQTYKLTFASISLCLLSMILSDTSIAAVKLTTNEKQRQTLHPQNLSSYPSLSFLDHCHVTLQLGRFQSHQGQAQHINMESLIGDDFTLSRRRSSNGLVGIGYFLEGPERRNTHFDYGINAFYLAKTTVTGDVVQESLFTNLSYQYNVAHYPIYAMMKSTTKTDSKKYAFTIDAGIGPNFIKTNGFKETSLDGDITIPDSVFSGRTSATFSATVGVGLRFNNVLKDASLEFGYRFFYLGHSRFNKINDQLLNTLRTGNIYANAFICSVII